ncbi:MAG: T9SS type A sorting domain-containing protein [Candidatus Zixiibacteriota bacterium]|nr:MAG: T9SS type A sorting domain-containing protein [candidate division Zixibacteria bacterium]
MKGYKILIIIAAVLCSQSAHATIIHIPGDYPTIQQGINASADGDTVLVQTGTYVENINLNDHEITLASLFLTTGDTSYISTTIIDGDSSGSVITVADQWITILRITGFTIQNGFDYSGGGISLIRASPEISYNIIRNNSCVYNGGGIYCDEFYHEGEISNNLITENYAGYRGGGAYIIDSDPRMINNRIYSNFSNGDGGGLYLWDGNHSDLNNNVITGNMAQGDGGGISVHDTNPVIIQKSVIADNSTSDYGGGISCRSSNAVVSNSTISQNTAGTGGGIFCDTNSSSFITNSIFWADSAAVEGNEISIGDGINSVTYCDVQDGWPGEGNIDADPLFVDPQNLNFHIMEGSPCIDAGDPTSPYDPDGTIADMGAFYYDQGFVEIIDQNQTLAHIGFWFDDAVIRWQQFFPALDNLSAVELFIMRSGSPGDMIVQICTDAGWILIDTIVNEGNIAPSDWVRLDFSQTIDLVPGQPYRIYVFGERPSPSPYERYTWNGNHDSNYPGITDVYDIEPFFDYAFVTYGYALPTGTEQPDIKILPTEYRMLQNYPNPFNASTTIRYSLRYESEISLKIYNLLGQRVETLFDGTQEVGEHAVTWDASHLPSGIYFARLETGTVSENIKMILLK